MDGTACHAIGCIDLDKKRDVVTRTQATLRLTSVFQGMRAADAKVPEPIDPLLRMQNERLALLDSYETLERENKELRADLEAFRSMELNVAAGIALPRECGPTSGLEVHVLAASESTPMHSGHTDDINFDDDLRNEDWTLLTDLTHEHSLSSTALGPALEGKAPRSMLKSACLMADRATQTETIPVIVYVDAQVSAEVAVTDKQTATDNLPGTMCIDDLHMCYDITRLFCPSGLEVDQIPLSLESTRLLERRNDRQLPPTHQAYLDAVRRGILQDELALQSLKC